MDTNKCPRPRPPYSALPPPPSSCSAAATLMAVALTDMWQAALALALSRLLLLSCVPRCHPAASCGTHLPLHTPSTASPLCLHTASTLCSLLPGSASGSAASVAVQCVASYCSLTLSHLVACSPSRSGQVSSRCCACCFFMSHAGCFSCRRHLPQVAHFVHQVKPLMSRPPAAANANQLATSAGHHHQHHLLLLFPAAKCKQQTELLRN